MPNRPVNTCPNCGCPPLFSLEPKPGIVERQYDCGAVIRWLDTGEFFERIVPCPNRQQPDPMSAKQPLKLGTPSISG